MGRWYYNKKATVEESLDLNVAQLKKWGMLKAGRSATVVTWTSSQTGRESTVCVEVHIIDEAHVSLKYVQIGQNGQQTDCSHDIGLVTTPCNYGGVRYWFTCPTCLERVAFIYLAPGDNRFRCRLCNNLTYRSRNRDKIEAWGHTSRQIEKLQSEIKRRTWRGMPTRNVRRLHKLNRKMCVLTAHAASRLDKMRGRVGS
ncbi:MAG: hypothetical protein ACYSWW_13525 [Planctomycetota bacterium]|jgi:hypothetical protein